MNTAVQLPSERPPTREETLVSLLLLVGCLLVLGPLVVFGAAWAATRWDGPQDTLGHRLWLAASAIGTVLFAVLSPLILTAYRAGFGLDNTTPTQALSGWLAAWLYAMLLLPLSANVFGFFRRIERWLKPRTLQEGVEAQEAWFRERDARLSGQAVRQISQPPAVPTRVLRLGPTIHSQNFPRGHMVHKVGRWLALEERLLDRHLFILGSTGAGKSETLKRLAAEVLEQTDRDLFLVDGKGDPELAQTFRDLAWRYGRGEAPIFRLGTGAPGARYDGFRGAREDIYNRLVEMVGASTPKGQAEGDSEHYKAINRNLLQLICYPEHLGPPRSFEEVRGRLDLNWLRDTWKQNPVESHELAAYKPADISGLRSRLAPLVREFAPLIGPDGFALEETRAAVFSLRTQSAGDSTTRLLRFLIEDLKDFAGKRQRRPAIFMIDEFGAFGTTGILSLLALARSAQLGIVLATQDVASLGDETERRLILANTRTKLLMGTDYPEEVASLAGTITVIESSIQHDQGEATGLGSSRPQHAFAISMNEVPRLKDGEAYLIRARHAVKLQVAAIAAPPPAPPERLPPWPIPTPDPGMEPEHDESDELEEDEGIAF